MNVSFCSFLILSADGLDSGLYLRATRQTKGGDEDMGSVSPRPKTEVSFAKLLPVLVLPRRLLRTLNHSETTAQARVISMGVYFITTP